MRKPLLKRVLFQVHLWGGLALGLYALLIGVTGSVLVFREEIVDQISPMPEVRDGGPAMTMEEIRAGIQAHYPDWHAWSLEAPAEAGAPWSSYLLRRGQGGRMVFADATGKVIGERNIEGTWLQLFEQFHSYLLIPKGRLYNGIAGLLLSLIVLAGAVLWWPVRGEWDTAFRIIRRSNWKGVVYDLHRVGGALTVLFVFLFCITGAYFTWPAVYRDVAAAMLPAKPKPQAVSIETEGARQPIDALVASAQRAVPGAKLVRVLVPQGAKEPVRVVFQHGETREHRTTSQLTLNPHTGEVLAIDDYRQRRAGDHLVSWMGPLHTGHFGNLAVKIVWAVAGLAMPSLFVTGFLMWCNRVAAPRLRGRKTVEEAVAAGGSRGN
ncbi:MAG: PepSY-associated TM helix domain-containing protein [Bryobacteraceae bacterium]